MHGFIRQLFDYDGSNLFPRTRPDAFVSCLYDSSAVGITTIGELIDTSYMDPSAAWETEMGWEPEFIYRLNPEQNRVTGDVFGTMKAAKISQIPGLKFDAVLSEDLSVTNIVGIAGEPDNPNCPNGIYPAGTLLETIIIDILTRGASIYDVIKYVSKCNFTVSLGSQTITNSQTLELEEGTQYVLDYGFVYTDGSFGPSSSYTNFAEMNSTGSNAPHFRNGILWADSSISEIKVTEAGTAIDRHQNPDCDYSNRPTITWNDEPEHCSITVKPGTKVYKIQVFYTANQSSPKKSNGDNSAQSLSAGSHEFTFTINAIGAKDVTPHNPVITRNDSNITDPHTLIINSTGSTYTDIVVKSMYDLQHPEEEPTGIWVGDDVSLASSVVRKFFDGYFTPNTGYDVDLFNTNNNTTGGKLSAGNIINAAYLDASSVAFTFENNIVKVEQSVPLYGVSSSNTVHLNMNYAGSTVTPKKSNNQDSDVIVEAGTIQLTGTFNASTDKDVNKYNPNVSIYEMHLYGGTHQWGDTDVSGYVNFFVYDGYYTPETGYASSDFQANNTGAYQTGGLYKLDAGCLPFDASCIVNNITFDVSNSNITYDSSHHRYNGTGYFSGITLGSTNTFKIDVSYGNSTVIANKLSGRPSSVSISAGKDSDTSTITYTAPVPEYHYIMVTTNYKDVSNSGEYSNVNELINNQNFVLHLNDTSTNNPNTYDSSIVEGLPGEIDGDGRYVIIVAAPSDYTNVIMYTNGTPVNNGANPIIFTSDSDAIPYNSGTGNTMYKLFRAKGRRSGVQLCTIKITK